MAGRRMGWKKASRKDACLRATHRQAKAQREFGQDNPPSSTGLDYPSSSLAGLRRDKLPGQAG